MTEYLQIARENAQGWRDRIAELKAERELSSNPEQFDTRIACCEGVYEWELKHGAEFRQACEDRTRHPATAPTKSA